MNPKLEGEKLEKKHTLGRPLLWFCGRIAADRPELGVPLIMSHALDTHQAITDQAVHVRDLLHLGKGEYDRTSTTSAVDALVCFRSQLI